MVICPDCGKEVPNARFCKNCGARLPEVVEAEPVVEDAAVPDVKEVEAEVEDVSVPDVEEEDPVPEAEIAGDAVDETDSKTDDVKVVVPIEPAEDVKEEETVQETPQEKPRKVHYCHNCGNELDGNFKFCPKCGYDLKNQVFRPDTGAVRKSGEKNIILSIILSVIFPGLGQIYLGLDRKGALFIIGYVISLILILLIIGMILCFVIWLWALVDTIQSTNAINRGEQVEDKLF